MSKPVKVNIKAIVRDERTQSRAEIDDEVVAKYVEAIQEGDEFPPVDLFFDRENGGQYLIGDGWTRIAAHERAGKTNVQAIKHEGGVREAMLFAAAANKRHGLNRTAADIHRAINIMLDDPEWVNMSDREIARHVGCSPTTVGLQRKRVLPTPDNTRAKRTGKDGRLYNAAKCAKETAEDDSFNTAELEQQTEPPKKNGKPMVSAKGRRACHEHLGGLVRALSDVGLLDKYQLTLDAIAEDIKRI